MHSNRTYSGLKRIFISPKTTKLSSWAISFSENVLFFEAILPRSFVRSHVFQNLLQMLRSFPEYCLETSPAKGYKSSNDSHFIICFSSLISRESFNSKRNKFITEQKNELSLFSAIDTTIALRLTLKLLKRCHLVI